MTVNFSQAVSAYNQIAKKAGSPGLEARDAGSGSDFASVLENAAVGAIDTMKEGEKQSLKAAAGKADLNEVVTAVSKAEMTLQTVVTVRDKALQAYQEILRMPI
jgi:flagellar hook-basal body complex protein FliE